MLFSLSLIGTGVEMVCAMKREIEESVMIGLEAVLGSQQLSKPSVWRFYSRRNSKGQSGVVHVERSERGG